MKFTKMHGIGNDYIYINAFETTLNDPANISVILSDRNKGIGSDGLILIGPSESCDFSMTMFNADGSEGEMCGNGIRCVGKYIYDHGLTEKKQLSIETKGGTRQLDLHTSGNTVESVTVDMGEPVFEPPLIPVKLDGNPPINVPLQIAGKEFPVTCLSMGNPHCVTFLDNISDIPITEWGPLFELNDIFPNKVNTEFIQVISSEEVNMRVWERGSGETQACGTGATAAVIAANLAGHTAKSATVHLLGGDLHIRWANDNHAYMTGDAVEVFTGEVDIDTL